MKISQNDSPHLLHLSLGVTQVIRVVSVPRYPAWSVPSMVASQPAMEHSLVLPQQRRTWQRRCQLTASQGTCPPCPASLASTELSHRKAISSSPQLPISSWCSCMLPCFRASAPPDGTPRLRLWVFWISQLSCGSSHHLPPAPSQSMYQSTSTTSEESNSTFLRREAAMCPIIQIQNCYLSWQTAAQL